jgi:hypothetical protein
MKIKVLLNHVILHSWIMFVNHAKNLQIFILKNLLEQKSDKCVINWKFDKQSHPHWS